MIPNIAVLEIENPHYHMPRLWLPLFLLWIPLALVLILISPLLLIALLALAMLTGVSPWRIVALFWNVQSSLSGTHVHVTANGNKVLVRIL